MKIQGREIPPEIREQYKLEKKDYGVDGVSRLTGNRIEGWQSKFRSDQSMPTVTELATFWTESEYCDSKRTLANAPRLPIIAKKKINHEQTLLDKFLELREDFFNSLFETATTSKIVLKSHKFTPRPHQQRMISDVVKGLQKHDRGKLIAACGTGKTLAALWITESDKFRLKEYLS